MALVACVWPAVASAQPRESTAFAVVHINVIDVERGRVLPDETVVVAGDRIVAVGPSTQVSIPAGARIIGAPGQYLTPGLWDMHVHVTSDGEPPFDLFPAFGVTSIRDVGGSLSRLRVLQRAFEEPGEIAPRLFYCGFELDGLPPVSSSISIIADTPERARGAVRFLADQGVSCIKTYERITAGALAAVIGEARAHRLPVVVHPSRDAPMRRAADLGARGIEHVHLGNGDIDGIALPADREGAPLWDRQALLWSRVEVSSDGAKDLVRLLADRGVFLTPTLTTDEGNNLVADAVQARAPENLMLPAALLRDWRREARATTPNVTVSLRQVAAEGVRRRRRFIKAASDAGVPILAGSGGPFLGTYLPGLATHHELALLVQSGLTPLQALRAATWEPALFFDATDRLGAVAAGHLADLVLLDANPLDDIRNTRRIRAVVVNGRYLDRGSLDRITSRSRTAPPR